MNLPDITLIFQIFHFLIAYFILRRFVFAPSLVILRENELKNKKSNQKLHDAQQELNNFVEQQHQRWYFIKESLKKMSPVIAVKKCITSVKVSNPVQVEKTQLTSLEQESIKKTLRKKLLDI